MPFVFRVFEGCFLGEEIRREVWVAGSCLMDVVERLHEPLKDVFWSIAWHERETVILNHSVYALRTLVTGIAGT